MLLFSQIHGGSRRPLGNPKATPTGVATHRLRTAGVYVCMYVCMYIVCMFVSISGLSAVETHFKKPRLLPALLYIYKLRMDISMFFKNPKNLTFQVFRFFDFQARIFTLFMSNSGISFEFIGVAIIL